MHAEAARAPLARVAPQVDLRHRPRVHRLAVVHDLHAQDAALVPEAQLDRATGRAPVGVLDHVRRGLVHREGQLLRLARVEARHLRHPPRHVADRGEELRPAGDPEHEGGAPTAHAGGLPVSPPSRKLRIASTSEGKIR